MLQDLTVRHHFGYEAQAARFGGAQQVARQQPSHCCELAHRAHEPLCAAGSRHDSQLYFRLSQLCALPGDDDVAMHRELAAAAEREPVDRRDDRSPVLLDRRPGCACFRERRIRRRTLRELCNIGAGCERLFITGDYDASNPSVRSQLREMCGETLTHRHVQRIQTIRAVEAQQRHPRARTLGGKLPTSAATLKLERLCQA